MRADQDAAVGEAMRLHGRTALWRRVMVEREIVKAMWAARVMREARSGARIVSGFNGEVLRVDSVSINGPDIYTTQMPGEAVLSMKVHVNRTDWSASERSVILRARVLR